MDQLMAGYTHKLIKLGRGDQVEGKIIGITNSDLILDLGTKSEGVLPKKELSEDELDKSEIGSKIKAYVVSSESESGQILLSIYKIPSGPYSPNKVKAWAPK